LEDQVLHQSTFSVIRHGRFRDGDVLRKVFESIVRRCTEMGLVEGEGFAVDANVIEANASRFQRVEGSKIEGTDEQRASRPVRRERSGLGSI
jgi:transposase